MAGALCAAMVLWRLSPPQIPTVSLTLIGAVVGPPGRECGRAMAQPANAAERARATVSFAAGGSALSPEPTHALS
jgi:hypothetical protein